MTHTTEQERADFIAWVRTHEECHGAIDESSAWVAWQAARRAPSVPETIEQRAKKLKGLQVLIGATAGVPEAIELARSRFTEAYGRSPLHDDLAYACLLIDAYGGAPAAPVPQRRLTLDEVEQAVGYHSSAWDCVDPSDLVDAIFNLAAAPQPPEAALVPSIAVTPEMVEAANEAYCPFGDMELALCAALQVAPIPPGAAPVQLPENIREGEPYDNPAFEALARALGVWGTAQSAVCAQFWIAAKEQST